jgi:hypothetical protein
MPWCRSDDEVGRLDGAIRSERSEQSNPSERSEQSNTEYAVAGDQGLSRK